MEETVIPVIAGPTASGKTEIALALARRIGGEIISADSMQVYRHLSIGTAKPSPEELGVVTYHLIDHVDPDEQYHLGRFVAEATQCISEIRSRGNRPIICGGTGMYIRGLLYGVFEGGETNHEIRSKLDGRFKSEGLAKLYSELESVDPNSAKLYGSNDPQRIIRALEVFQNTGKPLSSFHKQDTNTPQFPARMFALTWPRQSLYERINSRVESMKQLGLLDEIRNYLSMGYDRNNPAIKALGYTELINVLENNANLDEALEIMKKKSRNYAKRQETWFRSMKAVQWIERESQTVETIVTDIIQATEKLPT